MSIKSKLNNVSVNLEELLDQANNLPDPIVLETPNISVSSSGLITAEANDKTNTKQLTTQVATTITPGTSNQTAISAGTYATGAVTVKGDSNLVASNIKSGVSIFGVSGSYSGSSTARTMTVTVSNMSNGTIIIATDKQVKVYSGSSSTTVQASQGSCISITCTNDMAMCGYCQNAEFVDWNGNYGFSVISFKLGTTGTTAQVQAFDAS